MPTLTLFTSPKPFTNPHIAVIQRNAIRSWLNLGPEVEVLLLGEEEGLAEAAAELGARHIPQVERNANGTPLVSSMFEIARQNSTSPLLGCVNADILLFPDIVDHARRVLELAPRFLMVGQRWDLEVTELLQFGPDWPQALRERAFSQGKLHRASGSDYFIFPRECFADMPKFAIGRAGWDNWMIYSGRARNWPVVDASPSVTIIHQNHDYSHLPGGQPHYKLPETDENIRLAGGKRTIFELPDASHVLRGGGLHRPAFSWKRFWREVEIFPLVKLHSYPLAQAFYFLFHPQKAYREFRQDARKAALKEA
ncbi:MAG: hypothetical protein JW987_02315 [Anaerolineaceae bacterium]|nr:hypothetical protein [Anaerolineaceae bacterium]